MKCQMTLGDTVGDGHCTKEGTEECPRCHRLFCEEHLHAQGKHDPYMTREQERAYFAEDTQGGN